MVSVLDPKREVGLWHSMLTVSSMITFPTNFHVDQRKIGTCRHLYIALLSLTTLFCFILLQIPLLSSSFVHAE